MKRGLWNRALTLLLVLSLLLGLVPAAYASGGSTRSATFEKVSPDEVTAELALEENQAPQETNEIPDDDEIVRVSIVVEGKPLLEQGYSTMSLGTDQKAQTSRASLLAQQQAVETRIARTIGEELDVVWNLTMAGNIISANVRYGDMEKIAATQGVAKVFLETKYEPCEVAEEGTAQPNTSIATGMVGANQVWATGYTGAGSRVAIIDTGLDTDHEAVDNGAYLHALEENAKAAGMTTEDYIASLDLLTREDVASVLEQMNFYRGYMGAREKWQQNQDVTADNLYLSEKVPFAFNYIDQDLEVTHDKDSQGGHGSHVAGIAAANRFIPDGEGGYVESLKETMVSGVAPDAQLIIMKVFGKGGGCYDSDYIAAIEDAILLGCDVVNLSLGSTAPGAATSEDYQEQINRFAQTDLVMSISAGNMGVWGEYAPQGGMYAEDVNYQTGGSPGSYDSSFTVASVDNDGSTGRVFTVGDQDVVYAEVLSTYSQKAFHTLDTSEDGSGTELEYIFLDTYGATTDYDGDMKAIVKDKIVFVSRSTTEENKVIFADKHINASRAGAKALIVYNHSDEALLQMSLSGSTYSTPCIAISRIDANSIREASTKQVTPDGQEYYTGKLTVGQRMGTQQYNAEYYKMSSFSSWGVPGTLTLKPEITAPGGSIYSIDGATKLTDQYTIMSGTSMAAPNITGQTALMAQYLRKTGLAEELGVSPRTLIHSLLMSTATPMLDKDSGLPYPVFQQGAGLANVSDAMNATSYVTVEGQPDGKVKAELGDDPDREGVYTFRYTLHNMTDEAQQFILDTGVYTQEAYQNEDGVWFAGFALDELGATVSYSVNGKEILPESGELAGLDFNGDGKVTEADGQAILDYAVGKLDALTNQDKADLNEDGKITAYDAELFLARLGDYSVSLAPEGETTVTVTIRLTEDDKAKLEEQFKNGAYIEAYTYARPLATQEGAIPASHSIPMLAFYGSWDDASMFDHVTYTSYIGGDTEYETYILPSGSNVSKYYNYILMSYGDDENQYILGGNNFATDEEYLPERNAISSCKGDSVDQMNFVLIRGAGQFVGEIANADTGHVYTTEALGHVYPAYYYSVNKWMNYSQWIMPGLADGEGWMVVDENGQPLEDGTHVRFTLKAATEYYVAGDGSVDWDALNQKATTMSLTAVVDNTKPQLNALNVYSERDSPITPTTGWRPTFPIWPTTTASIRILWCMMPRPAIWCWLTTRNTERICTLLPLRARPKPTELPTPRRSVKSVTTSLWTLPFSRPRATALPLLRTPYPRWTS